MLLALQEVRMAPMALFTTRILRPLQQIQEYAVFNNCRIVINDGVVVRAIGGKNRLNANTDGDCGTLGWYKTPVGGMSYFCEDITEIDDLGTTISNIQWAIGGSNLYLNQNLTKAQFEGKVSGGQDETYNAYRSRTAIIYRPSFVNFNDVVLITALSSNGGSYYGLTLWELRSYILDLYGYEIELGFPIVGISIDGGSSSQIAYKDGGNRVSVEATTNAVFSMVKTPM